MNHFWVQLIFFTWLEKTLAQKRVTQSLKSHHKTTEISSNTHEIKTHTIYDMYYWA